MCGIAGFIDTDISLENCTQSIEKMLGLITHRGPDEMGYYFDEHLVFGTARLSIIDSNLGQQPMQDSTGRYWLCYNGELYNYREIRQKLMHLGVSFKTQSDTEVVLASCIYWGCSAFSKFNGAFAFAFYDKQEQKLFLVRDRYGERPLFYINHPGIQGLFFASELKSFLAHPQIPFQFDPRTISCIFALWTPLPNQTPFQHMSQVPMGSFLEYTRKKIQLREYEALNFNGPKFTGTLDDAIDRTRELLKDSVQLRLRSDVPVGTYLSGGLDSAITTAVALECGVTDLSTFSVSFAEKEFDEAGKQQEVYRHLGLINHTLLIKNEDIIHAFPEAIWHAETPVFRTALVPMFLLSGLVQEKGIKVVLTGEGADELFLGYDIFKEVILRQLYSKKDQKSPEIDKILYKLYPYLSDFKKENLLALSAHYQRFTEEKISGLFSHEIRLQSNSFSLRCLSNSFQEDYLVELASLFQEHEAAFNPLDSMKKAQWLEMKTLLPGYLLSSQGDRMSLGHGVENRCPYLDPNLFHFANSLPEELKLTAEMNEKFILKQAFNSVLPAMITAQPKQPYRTPDIISFVNCKTGNDYLDLILSEKELSNMAFLNLDFSQRLIKKIRATRAEQITPKENHACIQLLSLALLNQFYISRNWQQFVKSHKPIKFVKKINGRILP